MVTVKAQGTLVLPFQRVNDLLKTVDSGKNKFHIARETVLEKTAGNPEGTVVTSIEFEATGNRIHVNCETSGRDVRDTFRTSFDAIYSVISELLNLSLRESDIKDEDTLMSVKDIQILGVDQ